MQYYPGPRPGEGHPVYQAGYPGARMQWSPSMAGVHTSQWTYDFSGYNYSQLPQDQSSATPHNIRDILGSQQQQQQQQSQGETLQSEIAKTPSYQKSPSAGAAQAGTVFHYPTPTGGEVRSPTTPTHINPQDVGQPGFYIPAPMPGRPYGEFSPVLSS